MTFRQEGRGLVAVAQLGARMHYAVPRALAAGNLLQTLYTDFYAGTLLQNVPGFLPNAFGSRASALWRRLAGRATVDVSAKLVRQFPLLALAYGLARRRTRGSDECFDRANLTYSIRFSQLVAEDLRNVAAVYGFNTASLEIINRARCIGVRSCLELTIAPRIHLQSILTEEYRLRPEIFSERPTNNKFAAKIGERELLELSGADTVIVPSFYVKNVINKIIPGTKCRVIPYGVQVQVRRSLSEIEQRATEISLRRRIRVLFVGEVGARKGAAYLLEAASKRVADCEVRFVGEVTLPISYTAQATKNVRFCGSVPRVDMESMYKWADLLVLPSLCEGSATVTYEALARGIPVIATDNAGSLIRHDLDGILVPIRDSSAIDNGISKVASDYSRFAVSALGNSRVALTEYSNDIVAMFANIIRS